MKFKQRGAVIDADQWFPPGDSQFVEGRFEVHPNPRGSREPGLIYDMRYAYGHGAFELHTLRGPLRLLPGDWVVTGFNGEKYVVGREDFNSTHDPLE